MTKIWEILTLVLSNPLQGAAPGLCLAPTRTLNTQNPRFSSRKTLLKLKNYCRCWYCVTDSPDLSGLLRKLDPASTNLQHNTGGDPGAPRPLAGVQPLGGGPEALGEAPGTWSSSSLNAGVPSLSRPQTIDFRRLEYGSRICSS